MRHLVTVLCMLFMSSWGFSESEQSLEILSPIYKIDRIYKSMKGPQTKKSITLLEGKPAELLWITGYRAVMVGPDGNSPQSHEFMCHSNLDFDIQQHRKIFNWSKTASNRLFTL